jgi:hypothetical protein
VLVVRCFMIRGGAGYGTDVWATCRSLTMCRVPPRLLIAVDFVMAEPEWAVLFSVFAVERVAKVAVGVGCGVPVVG